MSSWRGEEVARLRHGLYRFFAASLLYPDEGLLARLRGASRILNQRDFSPFAFYGPWVRVTEALHRENDVTRLESEYVRLFSVGAGGSLCPPLESYYLVTKGRSTALALIELEREYSRLGLVKASERECPPDHASTEMEAIAGLCRQEAAAWAGSEIDVAVLTLEEELSFLERHLGKWFPLFSDRLREAGGRGLYGEVVAAADAFLKHDIDLVGLVLREVRSAAQGHQITRCSG